MSKSAVLALAVTVALIGVAVIGVAPAGAVSPTAVSTGPNLIVNGDAESGAASGSGYDSVTIPGWQISGEPTVVRYGQHADGTTGTAGLLRGLSSADPFPTGSTPGPPDRGQQLFVGGAVGGDVLTQTISLVPAEREIDGSGVMYTLDGWLGGNSTDSSAASASVAFLAANGTQLSTASIGPVTALQRGLTTKLLERAVTASVPGGARSARITLTMTDSVQPNQLFADAYSDAYADDLSLHVSAPMPAPPAPAPPADSVGRLSHVFMVYMENEGDTDIVGNPAAPYLNGLINRYGLATDYHAIEHPSDPNYIAFFGGATFGIDTDCALACTVKERNLADQIETAHETWKFYEQTMPSPCFHGDYGPNPTGVGTYYAPDELPWSYFSDLADDTARCQAHVLPLTQMATDLASVKTTPDYVWFEADDCDDMEQCGIAAGDTWLSQTVSEIIDSPAFKTQRSAIFITWDEDFNNKGFNQDNQDQRVPMIVIASPSSGMLSGPVRPGSYYTHYGLLRTVQTALGLADTLSLNDRFATPLNGFWPAVPVLSSLHATRSAAGTTTLRYRDSAAGRTTFAITIGRRTVLRFTHRDRTGLNAVRVPVSVHGRRLAPGHYDIRATAANAAGVSGASVQTHFTVAKS